MTKPKNQLQQSSELPILFFVKDLPNICSLVGLLCAVLAIYYSILGNFRIAIIGMIWAVFFDWFDGIIARRMKGRTDIHRTFGVQIDSLIDIVSFGICPAIFLLSYGKFNPWFIPGAFVIVATSAIRLSYFNVFGLIDKSTYMGLALDNNVIILAFVFLFEGIFNHSIFSVILYTIFICLAALNIVPIRTPKFTGKWFYVLTAYTLVLTTIYCLMMWKSF